MSVQAIPYNFKHRVGTGKVSELNGVSYDQLVKLFGQPTRNYAEKVTFEWMVKVNNEVYTIYDYYGFEWSIGGENKNEIPTLKAFISNKLGINIS